MAKEEKISIREFAKRIHVSESAVRKAIETGKIVKGYDVSVKKINFSIAYKEYGQNKTMPKAGHGVSHEKVAEKLSKQLATAAHDEDEPEPDEELEDMSYVELIKKVKITPSLSYKEGLRRNQILTLAAEKIKLEETQNSLVRKVDVDKLMFAIGDQLKKDLQNIPSRVTTLMRTAANDVAAINLLTYEINQVLESYASLGQA